MSAEPIPPLPPTFPLAPPCPVTPGLGVVAVVGADAATFLQGQLTNDLRTLVPDSTLPAGLQNPQGRVIAPLRVIATDEGCLLIVAGNLAGAVATLLARYTLRARAKVHDASGRYEVRTAIGVPFAEVCASAGTTAPAGATHARASGRHFVDYGHGRTLVLTPCDAPAPGDADAGRAWTLSSITAGEPELCAETREAFTAHMLNLDLIGGVSFQKGCYTGQEIVARTEHLGRVKRRLFRYRVAGVAPEVIAPAPLSALSAGGAKVGEVCLAARDDRRLEVLAVVALEARDQPLTTAEGVVLEPAPLPYAVPA